MSADYVSTVVQSTSGRKPRWFRTSSAPLLHSAAASGDAFSGERFKGAGGVSLGLLMSTQDCVGPGSYIQQRRWYPKPGDFPARSCPTTPTITPPTSPLHDAAFRSGQLRVPEVRRDNRAELLDLSSHGRKQLKALYSIPRTRRFPPDPPNHVPISYLPLDDPRQAWAIASADDLEPASVMASASVTSAGSSAKPSSPGHSPPTSPGRGSPAKNGHSVFRSSCLRVPETGPDSWVLLRSHGSEPGAHMPDLAAMPWHRPKDYDFAGRNKIRANRHKELWL